MNNGWRGGEWSLIRVVIAGAVVAEIVPPRGPAWDSGPFGLGPLIPVAILVLAAILALGAGMRVVPLLLAALLATIIGDPFQGGSPGAGLVPLLLIFAAAPSAPFGSWPARDRIDPAGGWRLPGWLRAAALLIVVVVLADFGRRLGSRPPEGPLGIPVLIAAVLLGIDPSWIRRAHAGAPPESVFYDGSCGLCHRGVRFVLAEDTNGTAFRFAPLQSPAFERLVPADARTTLPDSIVVCTLDGRILVRSAGILRLYDRLGGYWRAIAAVLRVVPRPLRDLAYDGIARIRKRLFAAPKDICPLLPPHLRSRFLT